MRIRRVVLIVLTLLVSLGLGSYFFMPALAQTSTEPTGLKNVLLSIYPEYDDPMQLGYPAVLVMVDGEIDGATAPTTIRFLVPKDAVMYSAGSGPRNQYVGAPPNRKAADIAGWDEISYELKTNIFVVEYYAPISSQPERKISYDFRTLYPISNLRVVVQEPRGSSNYTVVPQSGATTGSDGLKVHSYFYNSVTTDKPLHFDIAYTKTDPNPSLSTGGTDASNTALILVIIVVSVALAVVFVMTRSRARPHPVRATRSQSRPARGESPRQPRAKFCSRCGQPVDGSAQFCGYCGNKLRGPS